jgi:hypothetical protein
MDKSQNDEIIKVIESIDVEPLIRAYYQLESEIVWTDMGHKGRQAGLQYMEGEDPWSSAVGRARGDELARDRLNTVFKDTVFEEIITRYNFKRTRFMWVGPSACYSMHRDTTPRVHIPLITNCHCLMIFNRNLVKHLEAGLVYYTDTREAHTAMNGGHTSRLHIVGAVEPQ